MLDLIRQKKQSIIIKVVFVVIVLSFVGTMFMVWGKGDDGTGSSSGYAAKVGGSTITLEQYQSAYQRIKNIYQQIYGQTIPADMEKMLGLKKTALDSLIDNLLITKEAKSIGIKVSKDEVAKEIAAMPMFQKDGAFSFDLYQQILKGNRMTPKEFEAGQKSELLVKKARQSIKDKVAVTDDDVMSQYKKENDRIELEYAAYAPSDVIGEIKTTDADLNAYLQKNQNEFKTAEKVAFSYILLDPSSQADKLSVTEDEIQTFYQKNIDRWQGKDGILPLAEVKEKAAAAALRQKAARQLYETAADIVYKNVKSADLNQIAGQLKAKVHEMPLFSANAIPQALVGETALVKKAFELKQGEMGGPIETAKGIYVLKVTEHKASVVPPLAEIRSAVEPKAKAAMAIELAEKKAGEAVKQMSAKAALKTRTTGSFTFSAKGDVPAIGNSPDLMEAAFKLTQAAPVAPAAFKVGGYWYAVRLKQRIEAPKDGFEKSKAQIKEKLLPKKQDEVLDKWVKGLRDKTKIEINQTLLVEK